MCCQELHTLPWLLICKVLAQELWGQFSLEAEGQFRAAVHTGRCTVAGALDCAYVLSRGSSHQRPQEKPIWKHEAFSKVYLALQLFARDTPCKCRTGRL